MDLSICSHPHQAHVSTHSTGNLIHTPSQSPPGCDQVPACAHGPQPTLAWTPGLCRDEWLQLRRECDVTRRAAETAGRRQLRLWQQRECYRAQGATQERESMLQQWRQWDSAQHAALALQRGWLKHSNRVCIALRAGIAGTGWHVSMVLEWQLDFVCASVLGCCHLLLIAATVSARAMLS